MPDEGAAFTLRAAEAITHRVFWPGCGDADDGGVKKVADCVAAIEPATGPIRQAQGGWPLICALTAMAVDLAIRDGDAGLAATLFENTAHLLRFEAQAAAVRSQDTWGA